MSKRIILDDFNSDELPSIPVIEEVKQIRFTKDMTIVTNVEDGSWFMIQQGDEDIKPSVVTFENVVSSLTGESGEGVKKFITGDYFYKIIGNTSLLKTTSKENITSAINSLKDELDAEVNRSTGKDEDHDSRIKANKDNITIQTQRLTDEIQERKDEDQAIRDQQAADKTAQAERDRLQDVALADEAKARKDADDEEKARALAAEKAITDNLNNYKVVQAAVDKQQDDNLAAETTRAKAAEKKNADDIIAERTRAQAAESQITTNLETETANREKGDSDLTDKINVETTRAKAAEKVNADNITKEVNRATAKEAELKTQIDNNYSEVTGGLGDLDEKINNEEARATERENQIELDQNVWNTNQDGAISSLESVMHEQNTDVGTNSTTFQLKRLAQGFKLKAEGTGASIRDAADSTYAPLIVGDITIKGNLVQEGDSTTVESQTVQVSDNTMVLNHGEVGAGVTKGVAGLDIDRGTLPDYHIYFDESDDRFKVGTDGTLKCLALRDDDANMVDGMFTTWDAATKSLVTTNNVPKGISLDFGKGGTSAYVKLYSWSNRDETGSSPTVLEQGIKIEHYKYDTSTKGMIASGKTAAIAINSDNNDVGLSFYSSDKTYSFYGNTDTVKVWINPSESYNSSICSNSKKFHLKSGNSELIISSDKYAEFSHDLMVKGYVSIAKNMVVGNTSTSSIPDNGILSYGAINTIDSFKVYDSSEDVVIDTSSVTITGASGNIYSYVLKNRDASSAIKMIHALAMSESSKSSIGFSFDWKSPATYIREDGIQTTNLSASLVYVFNEYAIRYNAGILYYGNDLYKTHIETPAGADLFHKIGEESYTIYDSRNFNPDSKFDKTGGAITGTTSVTGNLSATGEVSGGSLACVNNAYIKGKYVIFGNSISTDNYIRALDGVFYFATNSNGPLNLMGGGLMISNVYESDLGTKIPANGIYAKGAIYTGKGFKVQGSRVASLGRTKNESMSTEIVSFQTGATFAPGSDSQGSGVTVNDGFCTTYFWDSDLSVQFAIDIDGTGVAYRKMVPSTGEGSWKFLAPTEWVKSLIGTTVRAYLPLAGGTITGVIFSETGGSIIKTVTGNQNVLLDNGTEQWHGGAARVLILQSGANDILHSREGKTGYKVWDAYNLAKPATLDATQTFTGVNTFNGLVKASAGIQIGSTAGIGWFISTDRIVAGSGVAKGVNVGSLCVSDTWADQTKVSTNGIYSKGDIWSGSRVNTPFVTSPSLNAWTPELEPNKSHNSLLQVLNNDNADGAPSSYATILQVNSRVSHWATQLYIDQSNDNSAAGKIRYRTSRYGTTTYSPFKVIATEDWVTSQGYQANALSKTQADTYYYPISGKGFLSFDVNGRPVMNNNQGYSAKNASGIAKEILLINSGNDVVIGTADSGNIRANGTLVTRGGAAYLYNGFSLPVFSNSVYISIEGNTGGWDRHFGIGNGTDDVVNFGGYGNATSASFAYVGCGTGVAYNAVNNFRVYADRVTFNNKNLAYDEKFASYLPLSGGTISSSSQTPLIVNSTNATEIAINLNSGGSIKAQVGWANTMGPYLYSKAKAKSVFISEANDDVRYGNSSTNYTLAKCTAVETRGNNFVSHTNEFNFVPNGFNGYVWLNFLGSGNAAAGLTEYYMGNGNNGAFAKVRASGFVVNGGTASQFLKADGSVDSTGYLPLRGGKLTNILVGSSSGFDVADNAGSSWNVGRAGYNIQITDSNSQTPLLMARRKGAELDTTTASQRLLSMELLNSGNQFIIQMGGTNAFNLVKSSSTGTLFGNTIATTNQVVRFSGGVTAYTRNIGINGSLWTFLSNVNAESTSVYAPTSAGTSGQILQSSGGTPTWVTMTKKMVTDALGYTPPTTDTNTTYAAGTGLTLSGTSFSVKYGTAAGTACQGNDSRLSNSRPASDVYAWAKASTKPSYTASEVGALPSSTKAVISSSSTRVTDIQVVDTIPAAASQVAGVLYLKFA